MDNKEISQAVIGRLPRYFRYLGELKDDGIERISSQAMKEAFLGLVRQTSECTWLCVLVFSVVLMDQ